MRNCLAVLGLIFFFLLALLGAGMSLAFLDVSGAVDLGQAGSEGKTFFTGGIEKLLELALGIRPTPQVVVNGTPISTQVEATIQRTNLVEDLPLPTILTIPTLAFSPTPQPTDTPLPPTNTPIPPPTSTPTMTPTFTPSPVPPLDPAVYRAEVLLASRRFGTAMDAFRDGNDRLSRDGSLAGDLTWLNEMTAVMDEVREAGIALAQVGPPPPEYAMIDALLDRVAVEAATLRNNYLLGLSNGDPQHFNAASENFEKIRTYMAQAVGEMAKAGWPIE